MMPDEQYEELRDALYVMTELLDAVIRCARETGCPMAELYRKGSFQPYEDARDAYKKLWEWRNQQPIPTGVLDHA